MTKEEKQIEAKRDGEQSSVLSFKSINVNVTIFVLIFFTNFDFNVIFQLNK